MAKSCEAGVSLVKYLIKPVLCIAAVIAFILVANGTMKWFLNNAKDVAMDRTVKSVQHGQKTMPPKENPKP